MNMKTSLEAAIQGHLDKVAALRKRLDAIRLALDVMRSGDDELLMESPTPIRRNGSRLKRVTDFDEVAVESAIKATLRDGPMQLPQIIRYLEGERLEHSRAGVRRILLTSPSIRRTGERDKRQYHLN